MKNNKLISKMVIRPFAWKVLTISNKKGTYKIALKKKLFKNIYNVKYVIDGNVHKEKKEIILNDSINIEGIGIFKINDINTSIINTTKKILTDKNNFNGTKITDEFKEKEEYDKYMKQRMIYMNNHFKKEDLVKIRLGLITANVDNYHYHIYGYEPYAKSSKYEVVYGLDFVLKELDRFSKKIGFNKFNYNKLQAILNKIIKIENSMNRYNLKDTFISEAYQLHKLLSYELNSSIILLLKYIEKNNIDTNFEYKSYNDWWNPNDCNQRACKTIEIKDEFEKLIDAVEIYTNRVVKRRFDYKENLQAKSYVKRSR